MTRTGTGRGNEPARAVAHGNDDESFRRDIVNTIRLWSVCGRPACRRARTCRDARTACFEERRDDVEEGVFYITDQWYRLAGLSWYEGEDDDGW